MSPFVKQVLSHKYLKMFITLLHLIAENGAHTQYKNKIFPQILVDLKTVHLSLTQD